MFASRARALSAPRARRRARAPCCPSSLTRCRSATGAACRSPTEGARVARRRPKGSRARGWSART
eukprot:3619214-Prymnesium_polylepis.1